MIDLVSITVLAALILGEFLWPRTKFEIHRRYFFWALLYFLALPYYFHWVFRFQVWTYSLLPSLGLLSLKSLNPYLQFLIFFMLRDLLSYGVHYFAHHNNFFWKFHSVHHSSREMNVFAAFKHSWIDLLPGALLSGLLGQIILVDEKILTIVGMFFGWVCMWQHSNIRIPLPKKLSDFFSKISLSSIIITPENHRIHHELLDHAHHKNLGFLFTLWDHVFKTFSKKSIHPEMFGISEPLFPISSELRQFLYPFVKEPTKTNQMRS